MTLLKKLVFMIVVFSLISSPGSAVTYDYKRLPDDACPTGRVQILHHAVSDINVPGDMTDLPGIHFMGVDIMEVGSREEKSVEIRFKPGSLIPSVLIPTGFPMDMNEFVYPFLVHMSGGQSAQSFSKFSTPKFSRVTGELSQDAIVLDRIIGKRTLTLIGTPRQFFENLEYEIRRVQIEGFFALCRHNSELMSVMGAVLRGTDLRDVNYTNMRNLAQIFMASAVGKLTQNAPGDFSLKIGRLRFSMQENNNPADVQRAMADFLSRAIPRTTMERLESLFLPHPVQRPETLADERSHEEGSVGPVDIAPAVLPVNEPGDYPRTQSSSENASDHEGSAPVRAEADLSEIGMHRDEPVEGNEHFAEEEGTQESLPVRSTSAHTLEAADAQVDVSVHDMHRDEFNEHFAEEERTQEPARSSSIDILEAPVDEEEREPSQDPLQLALFSETEPVGLRDDLPVGDGQPDEQIMHDADVREPQEETAADAALLQRQTAAAVEIQNAFRAHQARQDFLAKRKAANTIASHFKGLNARRHFVAVKDATLKLQTFARAYLARKQQLAALAALRQEKATDDAQQFERVPSLPDLSLAQVSAQSSEDEETGGHHAGDATGLEVVALSEDASGGNVLSGQSGGDLLQEDDEEIHPVDAHANTPGSHGLVSASASPAVVSPGNVTSASGTSKGKKNKKGKTRENKKKDCTLL